MMAEDLKIVLIGAGVAGGVIARGLRKFDVEVSLIEQVSPLDHASAGNGLNIGPNALKALALVLPEFGADLRAASLPWQRWHAALASGTPLYEIPLTSVAECSGVRIRWAELYRIAREPLAQLIRFDHRCVSIQISGKRGRAEVALERVADGRREIVDDADLVIACDGRYSQVRQNLKGSPATRYLGVGNFRLLIGDNGASGIDDLEQYYNGPNRLLSFRLADGKVYLSGNFPVEPSTDIQDEEKTAEAIRRMYLPTAGRVEPHCAFLVDAACAGVDRMHWSRAQEIDTQFCDDSGQVLFVGDSAHAMAPTLGQGASQAIEDGCVFLSLFEAMYHSRDFSVPDFTRAYERLRLERVEFVKRFSWEASAPLLAGSDPVESNRDKSGSEYFGKLRRLYSEIPLAV
jgi:2-polyprenyl-6-methoxyphenol hydroxylase-like FAD-dependent oxidoreductase